MAPVWKAVARRSGTGGAMQRGMNIGVAVALITCVTASAGDFDGSKPLICAPVEALDCAAGEGCPKERLEDIGIPNFLRIDFVQKAIVGPKETSPILFMDK